MSEPSAVGDRHPRDVVERPAPAALEVDGASRSGSSGVGPGPEQIEAVREHARPARASARTASIAALERGDRRQRRKHTRAQELDRIAAERSLELAGAERERPACEAPSPNRALRLSRRASRAAPRTVSRVPRTRARAISSPTRTGLRTRPGDPVVVPGADVLEVPELEAPVRAGRGAPPTAGRSRRSRGVRARAARTRGSCVARARRAVPEPVGHRRRRSPACGGRRCRTGSSGSTAFLSRYLPSPSRNFIRSRERERELDELVVEERHASLDRGRHRHLVDPHQEQLGQPLLELEVGHLLQQVGAGTLALGLAPRAARRRRTESAPLAAVARARASLSSPVKRSRRPRTAVALCARVLDEPQPRRSRGRARRAARADGAARAAPERAPAGRWIRRPQPRWKRACS